MEFSGPKLYASKALVASTAYAWELPTNRFLQRLYLRLKLIGTNSTQATPADDLIAAFISGVRLKANGKGSIVSASLAELWRYGVYKQGVLTTNSLRTTDGNTVTIGECEVMVHFGLNPKDKLDISGLLPTHEYTSLVLEVDTTAITVVAATGLTFVSATLDIHAKEVELTKEDILAYVAKGGRFWKYYLNSISATIDAVYPIGTPMKVPLNTGKILRQVGITAVLNGAKSDAQVGQYRIHDYKKDVDKIDVMWLSSKMQDAQELAVPSAALVTGFTVADLVGLGSMDLRRYAPKQVEFQASTTATTGTSKVQLLQEEVV